MQALKCWLSCKQGCDANSQGWSSGSGWLCADGLVAVLMKWESWEAADRARTALLLVSDDRLQMSMEEDQMPCYGCFGSQFLGFPAPARKTGSENGP